MYQIYADDTLIYDSTLSDYKIGKGNVTLEANKSGSFTFSLYPDHFYYDRFVRLKTVITVYKSGKIIFRGRILSDVTDYWNNKVLTCEGELGFLQDSIIRPFEFSGTPTDLFVKFIEEHNSQVDEFKRFNIGTVTVVDSNNYIARSNSKYETALANMNSRLIEDSLGGYFYITHGEDGTEVKPTINYLADFTHVSEQEIKFGSNLKDYTKTVSADSIATAIIPLGAVIDDGDSETEDKRVTIESVNHGRDYVSEPTAVSMYGLIYKVVEWDDVTVPSVLKKKAEEYLLSVINQNITIELTAIDLHLLDRSIESFNVGDYIPVISEPHNFSDTLLCKKQTIDLLKPENDTITLGYTRSSFTESTGKATAYAKSIEQNINRSLTSRDLAVERLTALMSQSFGVFKTEEKAEDGSIVYYMHDKTNLSESTTIWKMTTDAFAVSTDGGKTWNAGLDSSGNAVVNILSTIGIKAEWLDVDNLGAISANIAGWSIDDKGIYKDVAGANASEVYRVYFQPPTKNNTAVLSCQKSTDGGGTFTSSFVLYSDGTARFGNTYIDADGYFSIDLPNEHAIIIRDDGIWFHNRQDSKTLGGLLLIDGQLRFQAQEIGWDTVFDGPGYTGDVYATDENGSKVRLYFYKGILDNVY